MSSNIVNMDFQRKAEKELAAMIVKNTKQNVEDFDFKNDLLFYAPVGAGKTKMCAEVMGRIKETYDEMSFEPPAFVWLSSSQGGLCGQSLGKIGSLSMKYGISPKTLDDLLRDGFKSGCCYFLPYEMLRSDGNVSNRSGERKNFGDICDERDVSLRIIAFADEAHADLYGEKTQEIAKKIRPNCLVEVTATPTSTNQQSSERIVKVYAQDVIDEHMIKVGYRIQHIEEPEDTSLSHLVEQTVKIQERKKKAWRKAAKKFPEIKGKKPKVLIQVASETSNTNSYAGQEKAAVDNIVEKLKEAGVKEEKIYIWMCDERKDSQKGSKSGKSLQGKHDGTGKALTADQLRNFALDSNSAEYLIFKQAVAKGWDCPTAATLLRLRHGGKTVFNAQTFGRIGRNPVAGTYFDDPDLDWADIITDDKQATIDNAIAEIYSGRTTNDFHASKVKPRFRRIVEGIALTSERKLKGEKKLPDADHVKNVVWEMLGDKLRDWNDTSYANIRIGYLSPTELSQADIFDDGLEDGTAKNKFSVGKDSRDYDPERDDARETYEMRLNASGMRRQSRLITELVSKYVEEKLIGEETSASNLESAEQETFERLLSHWAAQLDILKDKLSPAFSPGETKESEYRILPIERLSFEVKPDKQKYLYEKSPTWSDGKDGKPKTLDSRSEVKMVDQLNANEHVLFWFKNGCNDSEDNASYFSIRYKYNVEKGDREIHRFYPDFGVMLDNGVFFWLETKGGVKSDGTPNEIEPDKTKCKARDIRYYLKACRTEDELMGSYTVEGVNREAYQAHGVRIANPLNIDTDAPLFQVFMEFDGYDGDYTDSEKWCGFEDFVSRLANDYEATPEFKKLLKESGVNVKQHRIVDDEFRALMKVIHGLDDDEAFDEWLDELTDTEFDEARKLRERLMGTLSK